MGRLAQVKVGDLLAINSGWNGKSLLTVTRLTKTLVICGDTRFDMNGRIPGQRGYNLTLAAPATADDVLAVRIARAEFKLQKFKVTATNLEAVESLLGMKDA